jgi:MoaD family protein
VSGAPTIAVTIPPALRELVGGRREVEARGATVRELLASLERERPQLHVRLCDEQGQPRPHINVFVNLEHVRNLDGLDTGLRAGDTVAILPAVSGG